MKPEFTIDIAERSSCSLEARNVLHALDNSQGHHVANNLRPPLGIYNISTQRICSKLLKCCTKLEAYFNCSTKIIELRKHNEALEEIVDYLELALYAAAEHVDDVASIARWYFCDNGQYKESKHVKKLKSSMKKHKSLISASINAIKHSQARIRIFSLEIEYNATPLCLHGYFIEGVHNGVVGPNKIFHDNQREVFSITSLMWEIICFVLHSSRLLSKFLIDVVEVSPVENLDSNRRFVDAVISAARLPLYSFDDNHPFAETKIIIDSSTNNYEKLNSNIYGSTLNQWDYPGKKKFLYKTSSYEGDGATNTFKIVNPRKVRLQRWT